MNIEISLVIVKAVNICLGLLRYFNLRVPVYRWLIIWDVLRDLVPFAQFKKHEKHPCSSEYASNLCPKS